MLPPAVRKDARLMERYVVLDTAWLDDEAVTLGGEHGKVLGRFMSSDSARALALQRMAYGDRGVVVVDRVDGERIFPRPGLDVPIA